MPRFHIATQGIDSPIDDHEDGYYSKANLSDLFEYLSDEETEGLLRRMASKMRPGGRLAYWNMLVDRKRPDSLSDLLQPHPELAHRLWQKDRNPFYRGFVVEEITRPG